MYQKHYLFTNAITQIDEETIRVSLFIDEHYKPYRVPSYTYLVENKSTQAHFDEGDVPRGVYRYVPARIMSGFGHIHSQLGVVIEQNAPTIYLMQDAPAKGYYAQLDIKLSTNVHTLQIDDSITVSLDESKVENPIVDLNFIGGQHLDVPINRPLTEDELFTLNAGLVNQYWWDAAYNLYILYNSFKPFAYNIELIDEVQGSTGK